MVIEGLDKRLRAVLDNVINIDTLADIGADHGKISVGARLEQRAKRVIAVDISAKSLQKTIQLAGKHNIDNIDFLVGDGLSPIKEKVDLVIISGMGGREIIKILSGANYRSSAILVAHQDQQLLREFLSQRVDIVKDYIVQSGDKFYSIIVTQNGSYKYKPSEILFGKNYPNSLDYKPMLISRWKKINNTLKSHALPKGKLTKEYDILKKLLIKENIADI